MGAESHTSEHVAMLRDSVTDFIQRGTDVARTRKLRGSHPGYDRAVWKKMADFGWLAITLPEEYGGMGLGFAEQAIVVEGLARILVPEPVSACAVLAGRAILHGDNAALKAEYLPQLAGGTWIPALAFQEEAGAIDPAAAKTRAQVADGTVLINGTKRFIQGADGADAFLVSARSDKGVGLYLVPAGTKGVTQGHDELADGRFSGVLTLKDVSIPETHCVASVKAATAALDKAITETTVMAGAELLGLMGRALDMTLEYIKTRVQFGRTIGSFQVLQHRSVDLYIQRNLAEVALADGVAALDGGATGAAAHAAASRTKARCGDAALQLTRQAIQMHGAIGFTEDSDVGLYVKRAMVLSAWLGNSAVHKRRFLAHAGSFSD